MNENVPYATLQKLLHQLGFGETVVPSSHVVYRHAEPNTLLVYPIYRPQESVSWADLTATRRFLSERGLIEEDAFDRLLREPAA
jgi:hypothetical protein